MADRPKFYWDACAWIGLINQEPDKIAACQHVIGVAQSGTAEIWTSTLSLAEVFKKKCAGQQVAISEPDDTTFENFLSQDYVVQVQVDQDVGLLARRLLRKYTKLAKPADAIHLATALLNDCDELHTFDGDNLLGLSNQLKCAGGKLLKICRPPDPPKPSLGPLFEKSKDASDGTQGAAG